MIGCTRTSRLSIKNSFTAGKPREINAAICHERGTPVDPHPSSRISTPLAGKPREINAVRMAAIPRQVHPHTPFPPSPSLSHKHTLPPSLALFLSLSLSLSLCSSFFSYLPLLNPAPHTSTLFLAPQPCTSHRKPAPHNLAPRIQNLHLTPREINAVRMAAIPRQVIPPSKLESRNLKPETLNPEPCTKSKAPGQTPLFLNFAPLHF